MTTGITDVDWLDAKVCELSDKLATAQAERDTLKLQVAGLREALTTAAERFRDYETLHLAKETDDGRKKAASNEAMAEICEQALASSTPSNLLAYVEIGKLAVAAHKAGANWNEVQGGDWGEIMEAASAKLRAADEALSKACTSIIEKEKEHARN